MHLRLTYNKNHGMHDVHYAGGHIWLQQVDTEQTQKNPSWCGKSRPMNRTHFITIMTKKPKQGVCNDSATGFKHRCFADTVLQTHDHLEKTQWQLSLQMWKYTISFRCKIKALKSNKREKCRRTVGNWSRSHDVHNQLNTFIQNFSRHDIMTTVNWFKINNRWKPNQMNRGYVHRYNFTVTSAQLEMQQQTKQLYKISHISPVQMYQGQIAS